MLDERRRQIGALAELDVLRQIDHDRAGPSVGGHKKGLMHGAGEIIRILYQIIMLGDRTCDADGIRLLEGVIADHMGRHLPRQADDRNAVHQCIGKAGDRIRRAGTGGDEHDARLAGGTGIPLRRVNRATFLTDKNVANAVLLENLVIER